VGVGKFTGGFVFASWGMSVERGAKTQITVELNSDGAVTWTAA